MATLKVTRHTPQGDIVVYDDKVIKSVKKKKPSKKRKLKKDTTDEDNSKT